MSVIPSLKMNTGAVVPAIGMRSDLYFTSRATQLELLLGLGCWAGNDPTDRENARSWFLSALKVDPPFRIASYYVTNGLLLGGI